MVNNIIISQFAEFGTETSKYDQDVWKLGMLVCQCAFTCLMCSFVYKMIGEDSNIYMKILSI